MVDLEHLKSKGLSVATLKEVFTSFDITKPPADINDDSAKEVDNKRRALANRIRNRIQAGRDWNFKNYKTFHALDLAWNTPFQQVNPTLLMSLMNSSEGDMKAVKDKLASWGFDISKVIETVKDAKTGKMQDRVNVPAFYQIMVPLIRSYVTIRWAKIVNDRRIIPFFRFEPAVTTKKNRVRCEVITNRIEVMSRQMGYFEVMKQSVFQMLHYGLCLQFPMEQWYCEEQYSQGSTDDSVPAGDMVVKEGVRYHMPHPSRMFWDQAHRVSTFNTDTGCEYAGYWRVIRYRDIFNNPDFYNKDKIAVGATDWWTKQTTYWQTVFQGCTMEFPQAASLPDNQTNDRESRMAWNFYNGAELLDKSVTLTEYFEKIVPSRDGLGDYKHPVWVRFVVAGDTATVVYAEPVAYCPIIAYTYDSDENRDINASLSLEIMPFQDQFSNLMTQYLLTVQQNLTNLTMIDTDQVDENDIKKLENAGERLWRARVFMRYSGRKAMRAQQTIPNAVFSAKFAPLDTQSILAAMRVILDTLERVLVMSAQEVAQAASHEQTREEVKNIAANTSTRLEFTATPVDLARDAWKKQLYSALMAHGTENFYSYVAYDRPITEEFLKELGFTAVEYDAEDSKSSRKIAVKVAKKGLHLSDRTAVMLESFAAQRDGNDRVSDSDSAIGLLQLLQAMMASPYALSVGADQYFDIINQAGRRSGLFDRDFKLKVMFDPTEIQKKMFEAEAAMRQGGPQGPGAAAQQAQPAGPTPEDLSMLLQAFEQKIMEQLGMALQPLAEATQQAVMLGQQAMQLSSQNAQDIQAIAGSMSKLEQMLTLLVAPPLQTNAPNGNPADTDQSGIGQTNPEMAVPA